MQTQHLGRGVGPGRSLGLGVACLSDTQSSLRAWGGVVQDELRPALLQGLELLSVGRWVGFPGTLLIFSTVFVFELLLFSVEGCP